MSEREIINSKVEGLRSRRRIQVVLEYLVRGLFWGAIPAALTVFAGKLWILPFNSLLIGGALLAATALGFVIAGAVLRITPLSVANDIDVSLGLRERVSSAMALSDTKQGKTPFIKTLVKDAANTVKDLKVQRVYPWQLPPAWKLALPALLIAVALSFIPQLNWFVSDSDRAEAKLVQTEGQKLLDIAKQLEEQAEKKQDPVLKEQAEEIKRVGEKLNQGQVQKREALKELQRLKDKLETQAQTQLPPGERKLISEFADELKKQEGTRELGQMLEKGDFNAMMKELGQLMKDLAEGKMNPMQQEMMEDLLKSLEQSLKTDAAQDPSAEHLKEIMEQLKQSLEKENQLRQQLGDQLGAFEKDLDKLTTMLEKNGMQNQSQQLQQQMNQMNQQFQQSGAVSPQSLQQMLQSLQNAQQAVQNNQSLSQSQQQSMCDAAQQAMSHLQSQSGQPGQLSDSNSQAMQNRQSMAQQMQDQENCMGGG